MTHNIQIQTRISKQFTKNNKHFSHEGWAGKKKNMQRKEIHTKVSPFKKSILKNVYIYLWNTTEDTEHRKILFLQMLLIITIST